MACAWKWRELIAGWRWMVAGKWWCPGPCVGKASNCFRGRSWWRIEGFDTITHPRQQLGQRWSTRLFGAADYLTPPNPSGSFIFRHTIPDPKKTGHYFESRSAVFLFCFLFSQMIIVSFCTSSSSSTLQSDTKGDQFQQTQLLLVSSNP